MKQHSASAMVVFSPAVAETKPGTSPPRFRNRMYRKKVPIRG